MVEIDSTKEVRGTETMIIGNASSDAIAFRYSQNNGVIALRLQSGFCGPQGEDYEGPVFTFVTASTFITRAERKVIAPWTGSHDELTLLVKAGHIRLISCLGLNVPFSNQFETGADGKEAAAKELKWQEGATREDFYRLLGIPVPTEEAALV